MSVVLIHHVLNAFQVHFHVMGVPVSTDTPMTPGEIAETIFWSLEYHRLAFELPELKVKIQFI